MNALSPDGAGQLGGLPHGAPSVGGVLMCSACSSPITSNPHVDNRYRGCQPCGWRMHHGCWIELLSDGELPCPTVLEEVPAVLWKSGKVRHPARVDEDYAPGHGGIVGMNGEWETP